MKKKTFIVQLLDSKKPNKKSFTQIEDANFYSNDTDASLVFIPHEDTFEFQTAKVVMYNRGDESLVERDAVVTTENGRKVASYELPAEIIAHWGDWTAQPVFISGGEIYSGSIVPFSVIRYLMHERPATLTEIVAVTEFIQQSQALVDDMEQAEAQRKSSESSRDSAETQRLSNETIRVSAEAQRKIDHANRSAELAGKADKVVIKNLVENGDFSDGLNGWFYQNIDVEIVDGKAKATITHTDVAPSASYFGKSGINLYKDHEYYVRFEIEPTKRTSTDVLLNGDWAGVMTLPVNELSVYSGAAVPTSTKVTDSSNFRINHRPVGGYVVGDTYIIDNVMLINLTTTFGAGNEPTKEQMDELIEFTGYIDGEYALNNKEMMIWTLALIRRNKNAIITLGGA